MSILRNGPERVVHHCPHPCQSGARGCVDTDIPSLPLGSAWQCDECGRVWLVVRPPDVYRGMQRVPPLWRPASWWEKRRALRAVP